MARTPLQPLCFGPASSHAGVTLLEALLATVIVSIVASVALPSFSKALDHQRTATTIHALTAQLANARSTAITRGTPVTVCPSRGDGRCRTDLDWSDGWLAYLDAKRSTHPLTPAHVLRDERAPAAGKILVRSTQGRPTVRFSADGRAPGSNLTLRVCSDRNLIATIVINNVGRVRSQRGAKGSDCGQ